uniref:Serine racemase n=1 Tax=Tanacetum cinerariifolium TaxID=118510 RepID=A0A699GFY4_TANCI|nr:serine racemase [Tanacetum cinerariifolium]
MQLRPRQIAQVGVGAGRGKDLVVLAPGDQHRRLVLAEVGLPGRVARRIGAVAIKHFQLDGGVARTVQVSLVHGPRVRAHVLRIARALQVLPLGGGQFHQGLEPGGIGRALVGPVGLDRFPERIVEPLVVGIAVLDHDGSDALGMGGGQAVADGRAVILHVQRVTVDAQRGREPVDGVRQVVEAVGVAVHRRHIALAVAGVVGRDHVVAVRQQRDQVAEHLRRRGEAVQQQQGGGMLRSRFAVKDVHAVDVDGAVADGFHGISSRGVAAGASVQVRMGAQVGRQHVDEVPHFRRAELAFPVQHMHGPRRFLVLGQDDGQAAGSHLVGHLVRQQAADAQAAGGCRDGRIVAGDHQARMHAHHGGIVHRAELPLDPGRDAVGGNDGMAQQVGRLLRHAVPGQVGGRRAQHAPHLAHPQCLEAGVGQVADAHGHVDAFVHQVDHAVEEIRRDVHLGIGVEEPHDARHDERFAEQHRRRHRQVTLGPGIDPGRSLVGFGNAGQNAAAVVQVAPARLGQPHVARGALQELDAQLFLQRGNGARDGRRRQVQPPRRPGKACFLARRDKNVHQETGHGSPRFSRRRTRGAGARGRAPHRRAAPGTGCRCRDGRRAAIHRAPVHGGGRQRGQRGQGVGVAAVRQAGLCARGRPFAADRSAVRRARCRRSALGQPRCRQQRRRRRSAGHAVHRPRLAPPLPRQRRRAPCQPAPDRGGGARGVSQLPAIHPAPRTAAARQRRRAGGAGADHARHVIARHGGRHRAPDRYRVRGQPPRAGRRRCLAPGRPCRLRHDRRRTHVAHSRLSRQQPVQHAGQPGGRSPCGTGHPRLRRRPAAATDGHGHAAVGPGRRHRPDGRHRPVLGIPGRAMDLARCAAGAGDIRTSQPAGPAAAGGRRARQNAGAVLRSGAARSDRTRTRHSRHPQQPVGPQRGRPCHRARSGARGRSRVRPGDRQLSQYLSRRPPGQEHLGRHQGQPWPLRGRAVPERGLDCVPQPQHHAHPVRQRRVGRRRARDHAAGRRRRPPPAHRRLCRPPRHHAARAENRRAPRLDARVERLRPVGCPARDGHRGSESAMTELNLPTYADVVAAAERIAGVAHRTPVLTSRTADAELGAEVFFKCENLQRMGAFKFRGAYNALAKFDAAQRRAGVVAYSSGNHAQGIALSAQLAGIPATIVMPHDAPPSKIAATRARPDPDPAVRPCRRDRRAGHGRQGIVRGSRPARRAVRVPGRRRSAQRFGAGHARAVADDPAVRGGAGGGQRRPAIVSQRQHPARGNAVLRRAHENRGGADRLPGPGCRARHEGPAARPARGRHHQRRQCRRRALCRTAGAINLSKGFGNVASGRLSPRGAERRHGDSGPRSRLSSPLADHAQGAVDGEVIVLEAFGLALDFGDAVGRRVEALAVLDHALVLRRQRVPHIIGQRGHAALALDMGQQEQLRNPRRRHAGPHDRRRDERNLLAAARLFKQGLIQLLARGDGRLDMGLVLRQHQVALAGQDQHGLEHLLQVQALAGQRVFQLADGARCEVGQQVQQRQVDRFAQLAFDGLAGDLEIELGARRHQHHARPAHGLGLLQQRERARALDPVVGAEILVDHEVAHALGKHGIGQLGQQLLLRPRQVQVGDVVEEMRRAGVGQLGFAQDAGHLGKAGRLPVAAEVFVHQVLAVLPAQRFQAVGHAGIGGKVGGTGFQQAVGKIERALDALGAAGAGCGHGVRILREQAAHGHHRRPARLAVVADADVVEVGQVVAPAKLGKRLVQQLRAVARRVRQFARKGGLGRIEIGAVPGGDAGGRVNVGGQALAETEFARHAGGRRLQPGVGKRHGDAQRVQLLVRPFEYLRLALQFCQLVGRRGERHAIAVQRHVLLRQHFPGRPAPGGRAAPALRLGQQEQLRDARHRQAAAHQRASQVVALVAAARAVEQRQVQLAAGGSGGGHHVGRLRRRQRAIAAQDEHRLEQLADAAAHGRQPFQFRHRARLVVLQDVEQGRVQRGVERDLQRAGLDLEVDIGARHHHHHALAAHGRFLFRGRQAAGACGPAARLAIHRAFDPAFDPIVAAEILVHHQVAHALACRRVGQFGQQRPLRRAQVEQADLVEVVGGAGKFESRRAQRGGLVGKADRLPILIKIFVRQVAPVLAVQGRQLVAQHRVFVEVGGTGGKQLLRKVERGVDAAVDAGAGRRHALDVTAQQVAQRHHRRPARLAVVADVQHAAGLELALHEVEQQRPVGGGHPAPDPVQGDEIEVGQVGADAVLVKRLVHQLRAAAAGARQLRRMAGLDGIEIGAVPGRIAGSRVDVGGQTLAEAQFAGVGHGRHAHAGMGQRHGRVQGTEFAIVAVGVVDVCHVATGPLLHCAPCWEYVMPF